MKIGLDVLTGYMHKGLEELNEEGIKNIISDRESSEEAKTTMRSKDTYTRQEENVQVSFHYIGLMKRLYPALFTLKERAQPLRHNHEFFELVYVYRGEFTQWIEKREEKQGHSRIFLLNPYMYHGFRSKTDEDIAVNFLIDPSFVQMALANLYNCEYQIISFLLDAVYGSKKKAYLVFETTEELEAILNGLMQEYFERKPFYREMIRIKMTELFVYLARIYQPQDFDKGDWKESLGDKIEYYLSCYYATADLKTMAENFGYTTYYMSFLVKKYTGKTFSENIREYRLKSACELLVRTKLTVNQINQSVGYESENSLFRVIKREYGMSPSEYRERNRNNGDSTTNACVNKV